MKFAITIIAPLFIIAVYVFTWSLCALSAEADRSMDALSNDTEDLHVHQ